MSDGVPAAPPIRQRDEVPPTLPASSNQLRVVHHALDDDDSDTLVSENSRQGVVVSQHESENEEKQLWERHSLASGISDVEAAVEVEVEDSAVEVEMELEAAQSRSARAAFRELDGVDVPDMFAKRGVVMQNVPRSLRGAFRNAVRVALDEIKAGRFGNDETRQERGWKLFLLIPRMLLHREPRGGTIAARSWFNVSRGSLQATGSS